ncbi:hypothetical protein RSOLAG22IIIB_06801 [Rhizoctonia solani]|uniref:Uncharacterized protein n=1 Tax=Rhizoctonia solani TaxID=456999 RepID=A0A0K6GH68_9AGAM|nr:hypothetical protein RSOLAG22IIIB_06801 [Rhizoctonia solani]
MIRFTSAPSARLFDDHSPQTNATTCSEDTNIIKTRRLLLHTQRIGELRNDPNLAGGWWWLFQNDPFCIKSSPSLSLSFSQRSTSINSLAYLHCT